MFSKSPVYECSHRYHPSVLNASPLHANRCQPNDSKGLKRTQSFNIGRSFCIRSNASRCIDGAHIAQETIEADRLADPASSHMLNISFNLSQWEWVSCVSFFWRETIWREAFQCGASLNRNSFWIKSFDEWTFFLREQFLLNQPLVLITLCVNFKPLNCSLASVKCLIIDQNDWSPIIGVRFCCSDGLWLDLDHQKVVTCLKQVASKKQWCPLEFNDWTLVRLDKVCLALSLISGWRPFNRPFLLLEFKFQKTFGRRLSLETSTKSWFRI